MNRTLLALTLVTVVAAPLWADGTARYIVGTRRSARLAELRMLRDVDAAAEHRVRTFEVIDGFAADLTEAEVAELRQSREVRYISPVEARSLNDTFDGAAAPAAPATTGTRYGKQQIVPWGIDQIRSREVWPATRGAGGNVNVVVMDTGVDAKHPDLQGRYAGGYNTFTKQDDPVDDHRHGTHVSGTIAAVDNSQGVVGVAPETRLWAVKVLNANGDGTDETLIEGLDWVIAKKHAIGGNWIVNLSLGASRSTAAEQEAFRKAIDEGLLIVAAAGNRSFPSCDYPALYTGVVAVAATEANDEKAGFSSFGVGLSVSAPGVGVVSTVPVGSVSVADVALDDGTVFDAFSLTGSPKGEVRGAFVYCGVGRPEDFPAAVNGKVAVIHRGANIYFRDKVKAAKAAGAIAVVLVNDDDSRQDMPWTLWPRTCDEKGCSTDPADEAFPFPLTVSISAKDGEKLLAQQGRTQLTASYRNEDYNSLNGTSMATPHVTGAAALAWSLAPTATAEQVRLALKLTAKDLNSPGWDMQSGYGLVDALALAKYLNPAAFGLGQKPSVPLPKRRSVGH